MGIEYRTVQSRGRGEVEQGNNLTSAEQGVRQIFGKWVRFRCVVGFESTREVEAGGRGRERTRARVTSMTNRRSVTVERRG